MSILSIVAWDAKSPRQWEAHGRRIRERQSGGWMDEEGEDMSTNTVLTDGIIITTLLLKIKSLTGLGYAEILAQSFPELDAGVAESLANDAMIAEERKFNAAIDDGA